MSVLKIHLTYQCTAACAHCRFGCTPEPAPVIDEDLVLTCVQELQSWNNLKLVVLLGGEPSLHAGLTHRLTAAIHALGIGVRVETNASWATSDDTADAFLAPLYREDASVMFSLDALHEPFVKPERVRRAIRVSEALGGKYSLETAYLNAEQRTHPLDQRTDTLLSTAFETLGHEPPIYRGTVLYNGRAAHRLANEVSKGRGVPTGPCLAAPWWIDSDLDTLDLLILDPDGYISKGCGIAIGNMNEQALREMLSTFDARTHPVFSTLMTDGPIGLAREAEALGYEIKPDYADRCHLCQEAREALRDKYPHSLQPTQHYRLN